MILPVFLWLVFVIMEIGYLSYRMIVLQHMAYETARIGSLTTTPTEARPGCPRPQVSEAAMTAALDRMAAVSAGQLSALQLSYTMERSLRDPQEGCDNFDLVVTLSRRMPLIFPMTRVLLGSGGGNERLVAATVRMPIERPLFK